MSYFRRLWESFLFVLTGRLPARIQHRSCWVYCPRCRRDLNGDDSSFIDYATHPTFASFREFVHYRCASCGCETWWEFDTPAPHVVHRR